MDQKKSADIVPAATGPLPVSRRRQNWLERDFDTSLMISGSHLTLC